MNDAYCKIYPNEHFPNEIAQNTGINNKDVKNKKLQADEKWIKSFKPRTP